MKTLGLQGVRRAKGIRTTIPSKDGVRAGDLLNRDFTAAAPNTVWVTDFTYVRTWAGWTYVAFIVDVFSQRIVAWHAATNKEVDLVMTPLRIALWQRDRDGHPVGYKELIHHSDAGSQYTSIRLTGHLGLEGISPSIGSVGDAYDNALMETINGLYKTNASAPRSSTPARTRRSRTWSTRPRTGSTGTTTGDCTVASTTCHPLITRRRTTRLRKLSYNPYDSGTEPGAVQQEDQRHTRRSSARAARGTSGGHSRLAHP